MTYRITRISLDGRAHHEEHDTETEALRAWLNLMRAPINRRLCIYAALVRIGSDGEADLIHQHVKFAGIS